MRNFKKFLALVLAMLMVSACAVSVSAAYSDQDAIDATGFAKAVSLLYDLKVMQGSGDGSFNPNGTLTRAEAAVIASKLKAGTAGQSMNWTSATSSFVDVAPEYWGNAYINYVSQRGIMDGIGDGKFAPEATLSIAEAIVIAVKTAGLQGEVAKLNETFGVPTFWAANWIAVAGGTRSEGPAADSLLDSIVAFDYTAPCTRAMFAQIAYNMIEKNIAGIKNGFGLETEIAVVKAVADGKVTLDDQDVPQIAESALDAALAAAGIEKKSADLVNYKIKMLWNETTYAIYSVDVLTTAYEVTYALDAIKYVDDPDKSGDEILDNKLNIAGVDYVVNTVNADADSNQTPDIIGGTVSTDTNGIMIEIDGVNVGSHDVTSNLIPAFYKAVGYDDNGDMDIERAFVTSYQLVTLTKGEEFDHDNKNDTAKVFKTVVKEFQTDGTPAREIANKYLTVGGAAYTNWSEVPVLVDLTDDAENVNVMSGVILETAEKVTGIVSSIKPGEYITITNKIPFAAGFEAPANWTLGQNVTVYTIGGKYVDVASADTGVESGMTSKNVIVDNVAIADGKAVVTGFVNDVTFAPITLTVVGVVDGGKLVARNAYLDDKDNAIDYDKNGKVEDADKAFVAVALGTAKNDKAEIANKVVIEDNTVYTFNVTSAGAYLDPASEAEFAGYDPETLDAAIIENGLIKTGANKTAEYRLEGSYVVVTKTTLPANNDKAYTYYSGVSYKSEANAALPANTDLTLAVIDKNGDYIENALSQNVALIYITGKTDAAATNKVLTGLNGLTIVKLISEESVSLDYNTYKAVDIFTGAEVEVTGNVTINAANPFATVNASGVIQANATQWIAMHAVTVNEVLGKVDSVVAYNSYLEGNTEKVVDGEATLKHYDDDANKVTIGVDAIIWKYDGNKLVADTDYKFALGQTEFYGFINGGKVVVLPTPAAE